MTTSTQHRSGAEAPAIASVRVMTDAEAAELGTTCDHRDRRSEPDPAPAAEPPTAGDARPVHRYFWIMSVDWARPDGSTGAATLFDVGTTNGTVSRSEVFRYARHRLARKHGVPPNATITYFAVEPEVLTFGPAEESQR